MYASINKNQGVISVVARKSVSEDEKKNNEERGGRYASCCV